MKPDEPQQGRVDNWTFEDPVRPEPDMDAYYMRQEEKQKGRHESETDIIDGRFPLWTRRWLDAAPLADPDAGQRRGNYETPKGGGFTARVLAAIRRRAQSLRALRRVVFPR